MERWAHRKQAGLQALGAIIAATTMWTACAASPGESGRRGEAPGETPQGLSRVAFGSCAHQDKPQPIWGAILAAAPERFLFIGDNVYGDVKTDDPEMPELRNAYEKLSKIEDFQTFRARTPILPMWDDHDFGLNDGGADFGLKREAQALFVAFWGIDREDARVRRPGLYHAQIEGSPGRRVQLILLDTRSFRSALTPSQTPGQPGRERYQPEADPERTMLGDRQWAWLKEQLERPAEVRLIASGVQILAEGHGYERWGNLPLERARLFELLGQTQAGGVVLLSGDRHLGALYRSTPGIHPAVEGRYPIHELTSSALNMPMSGPGDGPDAARVGEVYTRENFGLVEIDWSTGVLTLSLRDLEGEAVMEQTIVLADLPGR